MSVPKTDALPLGDVPIYFLNSGWASWTRTKTNGFRVRCSTFKLIPSILAERERFELSKPFGLLAFEASAFNLALPSFQLLGYYSHYLP